MNQKLTFIFICFLFTLLGCNSNEQNSVIFKDYKFNVELAITADERSTGLMNRANLDKDKGMLFIFKEQDVYPFWMKNTLIPLDIIWIDKDMKVVYINQDTGPCKSDPCESFNPGVAAKYVLELNSGIADDIGLAVGHELQFNIDE